ncbi:MAG: ChbG/HpnK family deacetylase [Ruminococcaceae bacterium]|nr:ChbG/HpnK family deacetylase [Oscillospiraceae bacterium]
MIYICADDYGISEISSARIRKCIEEGALNKVSIFPNFDSCEIEDITQNKNIYFSLHLNLVEGKCVSDRKKVRLLTDENGNFKYSFTGLLKLSLSKGKEFENQVYAELKSQILKWKNTFNHNSFFLIDSHQHTHMIPAVFRALVRVVEDENINLKYLRIPSEPLMPYIKTPSLYFTYSPVNLIKQWLLKFLWIFSKKTLKKHNIPTAYFFGILFSGKMDMKRVEKILPKYISLAKKKNKDIEVLFHPGYISEQEADFNEDNIPFKKFYFSKNRKTEFDAVMNMSFEYE